jgi:hypothetical protein
MQQLRRIDYVPSITWSFQTSGRLWVVCWLEVGASFVMSEIQLTCVNCSVIGFMLILLFVPETKSLTLEELDQGTLFVSILLQVYA